MAGAGPRGGTSRSSAAYEGHPEPTTEWPVQPQNLQGQVQAGRCPAGSGCDEIEAGAGHRPRCCGDGRHAEEVAPQRPPALQMLQRSRCRRLLLFLERTRVCSGWQTVDAGGAGRQAGKQQGCASLAELDWLSGKSRGAARQLQQQWRHACDNGSQQHNCLAAAKPSSAAVCCSHCSPSGVTTCDAAGAAAAAAPTCVPSAASASAAASAASRSASSGTACRHGNNTHWFVMANLPASATTARAKAGLGVTGSPCAFQPASLNAFYFNRHSTQTAAHRVCEDVGALFREAQRVGAWAAGRQRCTTCRGGQGGVRRSAGWRSGAGRRGGVLLCAGSSWEPACTACKASPMHEVSRTAPGWNSCISAASS